MSAGPANEACDSCLRRSALVASLAGWIDVGWRRWTGPGSLLALPDERLLDLCDDPAVARSYERFGAAAARAGVARAGLSAVCACSEAFPPRLLELPDPPAVLHVAGEPAAARFEPAVAVVGARRASAYGVEVARALGRGLTSAGVTVVSGLALGIDGAAHAGAVEARGPGAAPVAVLGGGADVIYPRSSRGLYEAVRARGAVVSELPPGTALRRWMFPARNRLIAALSQVTVVVEAAERSGSLITADLAADLGRTVAAVPGRVTTHVARGSNGLLATGAALVTGAGDVLDLLAVEGLAIPVPEATDELPGDPLLRRLLAAIDDGHDTATALVSEPGETEAVLRALAELEARNLVRRGFGGRYARVA